MIDWYSVGFSSLWILGLSLEVASLSFANYLGHQQNLRFRQALKIRACQIMVWIGLVFFCIGLAGSVTTAWERFLWAVLALIFALLTWQARIKGANQR